MKPTSAVLRTPLIRFLGKRNAAAPVDHTPRAHSQAPSSSLPDSFAKYRQNATTHGPLGGKGVLTGDSGELFARSQLPRRFHYGTVSDLEIENINGGGAEVVF